MKVFIQKGNDGEFVNENCYSAFYGFSQMGWEIAHYFFNKPTPTFERGDVVVGYIGAVRDALHSQGVQPPNWIDYPEEIKHYLHRKIWRTKASALALPESCWPIFVKPVVGKQFDGRLVRSIQDLRGVATQDEDRDVWCSEPVSFVSEYRCFVRYGKVLDVRRYKGDFSVHPNYSTILSAVSEYKSAPAGYAIDFGVTSKGETVLVEVNDGYSMGAYGLHSIDYAKLISARWHELVGLDDPCNF